MDYSSNQDENSKEKLTEILNQITEIKEKVDRSPSKEEFNRLDGDVNAMKMKGVEEGLKINQSIDGLKDEIDNIKDNIKEGFDHIQIDIEKDKEKLNNLTNNFREIKQINDSIFQKFDDVNQKIDGRTKIITDRIDGLSDRFNNFDQSFNAINDQFKAINQRFDSVNRDFDNFSQLLSRIDNNLSEFKKSNEESFKSLLDDHSPLATNKELDAIKTKVNHLDGWMKANLLGILLTIVTILVVSGVVKFPNHKDNNQKTSFYNFIFLPKGIFTLT